LSSSFLSACGASGSLTWILEGPGRAERLERDQPFLVVGSDPACTLPLNHPDVCPRHAYLQLIGGRLYCLDLGSRTGTYRDGRNLRAGWVARGQAIRIGPYRIRLAGDAPQGPAPAQAQDQDQTPLPAHAAAWTLELSHRAVRSTRCPVESALMLAGSAADCQVRLVDPRVSNYHCSLIPTRDGLWMVDLLGRGGATINAAPARHGLVRPGDALRIGESSIRLHAEAVAEVEAVAGDKAAPEAEPEPAGEDFEVEHEGEPQPIPAASDSDAATLPARIADLATAGGLQLPDLPADQARLAESFLVPFLTQFSRVQQRAERERLEAFAAVQREQLGVLREELDQVRELRQELEELRAELRSQGRLPSASEGFASAAPFVSRPRLGSAKPSARSGRP
jgi:pSer/pThr/pTyr-binding forkhead associated (FHA) protein